LSRPSEFTESLIVSGTLKYVTTKALYGFWRFAGDIKTFSDAETSLKI